MALADLGKVGAGDDVARGEFGIGMDGRHEALACLVDEDGAFAAEGLGGEGRRICTGGDGRGVELDEFGIGDYCAARAAMPMAWAAHAGGLVVTA